MSEEIVACVGCGKKFRIPEGAAPSGAFDCTACGGSVEYGAKPKTAKAGAGGGKAKPRGARRHSRRTAKKGARAAPAPAAAGAGRGGRQPRGERGARTRDRAESPQKENKNLPIVFAIVGGLLVIGIAAVAMTNSKKPKQEVTAESVIGKTGGVTADPNATTQDPATATPDPAAGGTADPTGTADPMGGSDTYTDPEDDTGGIGDVQEAPKEKTRDERYYWYLDDAQIFVRHDSTEDTTEEERTEVDRLVALACDMGSAKEGNVAEDQICKKWGKKAIPALISTFAGQTWDTREQQFSAFKAQVMLRAIVKADLPRNRDFIARFNPQMTVPPKDFKSAAKMWICHWLGNLQHKDEFKNFEDSEEE